MSETTTRYIITASSLKEAKHGENMQKLQAKMEIFLQAVSDDEVPEEVVSLAEVMLKIGWDEIGMTAGDLATVIRKSFDELVDSVGLKSDLLDQVLRFLEPARVAIKTPSTRGSSDRKMEMSNTTPTSDSDEEVKFEQMKFNARTGRLFPTPSAGVTSEKRKEVVAEDVRAALEASMRDEQDEFRLQKTSKDPKILEDIRNALLTCSRKQWLALLRYFVDSGKVQEAQRCAATHLRKHIEPSAWEHLGISLKGSAPGSQLVVALMQQVGGANPAALQRRKELLDTFLTNFDHEKYDIGEFIQGALVSYQGQVRLGRITQQGQHLIMSNAQFKDGLLRAVFSHPAMSTIARQLIQEKQLAHMSPEDLVKILKDEVALLERLKPKSKKLHEQGDSKKSGKGNATAQTHRAETREEKKRCDTCGGFHPPNQCPKQRDEARRAAEAAGRQFPGKTRSECPFCKYGGGNFLGHDATTCWHAKKHAEKANMTVEEFMRAAMAEWVRTTNTKTPTGTTKEQKGQDSERAKQSVKPSDTSSGHPSPPQQHPGAYFQLVPTQVVGQRPMVPAAQAAQAYVVAGMNPQDGSGSQNPSLPQQYVVMAPFCAHNAQTYTTGAPMMMMANELPVALNAGGAVQSPPRDSSREGREGRGGERARDREESSEPRRPQAHSAAARTHPVNFVVDEFERKNIHPGPRMSSAMTATCVGRASTVEAKVDVAEVKLVVDAMFKAEVSPSFDFTRGNLDRIVVSLFQKARIREEASTLERTLATLVRYAACSVEVDMDLDISAQYCQGVAVGVDGEGDCLFHSFSKHDGLPDNPKARRLRILQKVGANRNIGLLGGKHAWSEEYGAFEPMKLAEVSANYAEGTGRDRRGGLLEIHSMADDSNAMVVIVSQVQDTDLHVISAVIPPFGTEGDSDTREYYFFRGGSLTAEQAQLPLFYTSLGGIQNRAVGAQLEHFSPVFLKKGLERTQDLGEILEPITVSSRFCTGKVTSGFIRGEVLSRMLRCWQEFTMSSTMHRLTSKQISSARAAHLLESVLQMWHDEIRSPHDEQPEPLEQKASRVTDLKRVEIFFRNRVENHSRSFFQTWVADHTAWKVFRHRIEFFSMSRVANSRRKFFEMWCKEYLAWKHFRHRLESFSVKRVNHSYRLALREWADVSQDLGSSPALGLYTSKLI